MPKVTVASVGAEVDGLIEKYNSLKKWLKILLIAAVAIIIGLLFWNWYNQKKINQANAKINALDTSYNRLLQEYKANRIVTQAILERDSINTSSYNTIKKKNDVDRVESKKQANENIDKIIDAYNSGNYDELRELWTKPAN